MSDFIKELQNTWYQVKQEPANTEKFINELIHIEKKDKFARIFLLILFPLTLIALLIILPFASSIYYQIAITLICIGMLIILLTFYQSKITFIKNEAILDNISFINRLQKSLKRKMEITSRYMWIYTFLLISGINIGYIEVLKEMNISIRIFIHLALTLILFWFMYSGIKKKIKKNQIELVPIIEKLESIKSNISNP